MEETTCPELYAKQLSANTNMRNTVRHAAENGMPIVAECGGFMYLHSFLKEKEGYCHDMAGVIPATCFYTGKLVRFGYIELWEEQKHFLLNDGGIKGHEFHYYDSTYQGADVIAVKPVTGKEYSCIIENETQWMGFPHLYYPSNPAFAKAFVDKVRNYRKTKNLPKGCRNISEASLLREAAVMFHLLYFGTGMVRWDFRYIASRRLRG